jgi:hypothetical protein
MKSDSQGHRLRSETQKPFYVQQIWPRFDWLVAPDLDQSERKFPPRTN